VRDWESKLMKRGIASSQLARQALEKSAGIHASGPGLIRERNKMAYNQREPSRHDRERWLGDPNTCALLRVLWRSRRRSNEGDRMGNKMS